MDHICRPKLFENGSPAHHPLRFTLGCDIDNILLYDNKFILLSKENSSEFLKVFHYYEKFLLGRSVVTMWLAQYSEKKVICFCSD